MDRTFISRDEKEFGKNLKVFNSELAVKLTDFVPR